MLPARHSDVLVEIPRQSRQCQALRRAFRLATAHRQRGGAVRARAASARTLVHAAPPCGATHGRPLRVAHAAPVADLSIDENVSPYRHAAIRDRAANRAHRPVGASSRGALPVGAARSRRRCRAESPGISGAVGRGRARPLGPARQGRGARLARTVADLVAADAIDAKRAIARTRGGARLAVDE